MIRNLTIALLFSAANVGNAQNPADDFKRAENFRKDSKIDSAVVYYEKAADGFRIAKKNEDFVNAYNQIGIMLTRVDQYERARPFLNKALETGLASLKPNNLTVAVTYISLGVLYAAEEKYPESLAFHDKALKIRLAALGGRHKDVATCYGNIGNVYVRDKQYDQALEAHLKAKEIRVGLFGEWGVEVVQSYINVGNAYREKKDYRNALEYFQKALNSKAIEPVKDQAGIAKIFASLSEVYYLMGDTKQGDSYKAQAEAITRTTTSKS